MHGPKMGNEVVGYWQGCHAGANRNDEEIVSKSIIGNAKAGGVQPGQGTMWGRGRCKC